MQSILMKVAVVSAVGMASATVAVVATTTSGSTTSVIQACALKQVGTLRIVSSASDCKPSLETPVSWNVQGPTGAAGASGPAGAAGAEGPQGLRGVQGPAGANGSAGPSGPIGPQGLTGPQGPAGAKGASIHWMSSWSANVSYQTNDAVSFNGTSYIALATNMAIQPDVAPMIWSVLAQAGAAGPQGLQGPTGAQGLQGLIGPAGPAGATGSIGPAGVDGAMGPVGLMGPPGVNGSAGPQGPSGPPGSPGAMGPPGPAGGGTVAVAAQRIGGVTGPSEWTTIPGLAVPLSLTGNALVQFTGNGVQRAVTNTCFDAFRFVVDGVPKGDATYGQRIQVNTTTNWFDTWSISDFQSLGNGDHMIELQVHIIGVCNVCAEADGSVTDYTGCALNVIAVPQ